MPAYVTSCLGVRKERDFQPGKVKSEEGTKGLVQHRNYPTITRLVLGSAMLDKLSILIVSYCGLVEECSLYSFEQQIGNWCAHSLSNTPSPILPFLLPGLRAQWGGAAVGARVGAAAWR